MRLFFNIIFFLHGLIHLLGFIKAFGIAEIKMLTIPISNVLYFNEKGQLINFLSNDRYAISDMKKYPFSTPVDKYLEINGYRICTYGEAVWHYPEGEFVYGKFNLKSLEYNVDDF